MDILLCESRRETESQSGRWGRAVRFGSCLGVAGVSIPTTCVTVIHTFFPAGALMKIDGSIAVRAVRHANGALAEPGVCTPAIARYTGASGSLYIPLHESRGWGNLCTNLWQSLCLALLMNRVPDREGRFSFAFFGQVA